MMRIFREADAALDPLDGKTIDLFKTAELKALMERQLANIQAGEVMTELGLVGERDPAVYREAKEGN